jgi:hypothetical protein
MASPIRLGLVLNQEETEEFSRIEESYVVTPEQIKLVTEGIKLYRNHPIKFWWAKLVLMNWALSHSALPTIQP